MERVIEFFQFSTGVPLGYAIFYGFCLVVGFAGIVLAASTAWSGKFLSLRFLGGIAVTGFVAMTLYANIAFEDNLDLNPVFVAQDVVGDWSQGDSHIRFGKDGTAHLALDAYYSRKIGTASPDVTWRKSADFNIKIMDKGARQQPQMLRVIRYNGSLRIIVEDFDDPDGWNHDLGFKKDQVAGS